MFQNASILITGGTGSFGRALTRRLLTDELSGKVIIFSRDEWKQWEMKASDPLFAHPKMRYFLGDVRDQNRLRRAFKEVDIVIHAAALKQVPAAEYNPTEFVHTNIIGSMNVIEAAIDRGVKRVLALSTDKACNPINLYGATKLCSDKLFVAGNSYVGTKDPTRFSVVRYGNVLGSRGSIIPFWQRLLQEGAAALPITDARMTRFWITLQQAVDFVLQKLQVMRGGEIFVPKVPSMRIVDLAKALAPEIPHEICGIREGEKLHEILISIEDARHTQEFAKDYCILPEVAIRDWQCDRKAPLLPDGFYYGSENNAQWLTPKQIHAILHAPALARM